MTTHKDLMTPAERGEFERWRNAGRNSPPLSPSPSYWFALIDRLAPKPPEPVEAWVNVDAKGFGYVYPTRPAADFEADDDERVACIKIKVMPGEGL